jgi:transcriptional regulator with XRE-family HTH domain
MNNIGARLREERERLHMTQDDFCAVAGVGKRALIHYEKDERSPDAVFLASVLEAGADVLYILTGNRSQPLEETIGSRPAALLDNYMHTDEEGKRAIERVALLESQHAKGGMKKSGTR